jgi:transcriptional regulator with XRE-family HTH domain
VLQSSMWQSSLASAILSNRVLPQRRKNPVVRRVFSGRDVTEVARNRQPGSPTVRRRELGVLLRSLRTESGWTVEQVADRLLVSPSKVSRLETGQRGASARDIRDLCNLYGVDDELRQYMTDLAAEGKRQGWWQSRGLPYSTYVGLESEAAAISDFGLGLVPGLLQTADYARATLHADVPTLPEPLIRQRLQARLERQRLLVSADPPQFDAILDESVLHRVIGSSAIMRAQLERLVELSQLPNVTVRVLPYDAGLLPVPNNKFIILKFSHAAIPDVVFIEGLTGDLYLDRAGDTDAYATAFGIMGGLAASAERTRAMIASIAATLDSKGLL